jgi:hypothetical protein
MIRHPVVAILVAPVMALPFAFLTLRTNSGWRSGDISSSSAGAWIVLGLLYLALIACTVARALSYRVERSYIESRLPDDGRLLWSTIEASGLPQGFVKSAVPRTAWLVTGAPDESARLYWRSEGELAMTEFANGAPLRSVAVDDSSFTPLGRPVVVLEFAGVAPVRIEMRGPFGKLWPLAVTRLVQLVDAARRVVGRDDDSPVREQGDP